MSDRDQTRARMDLENAVWEALEAGLDADEITSTVEATLEDSDGGE